MLVTRPTFARDTAKLFVRVHARPSSLFSPQSWLPSDSQTREFLIFFPNKRREPRRDRRNLLNRVTVSRRVHAASNRRGGEKKKKNEKSRQCSMRISELYFVKFSSVTRIFFSFFFFNRAK